MSSVDVDLSYDETVDGIHTASMAGAEVILTETTLKALVKRTNLQAPPNFRRMIIDIDDASGNINTDGAWLFSERLFGALEDGVEQELILIAGGKYQAKEQRVRPVIELCAALAYGDYGLRKAVKFDGDGGVVHGVDLDERELCSSLSAMSHAIKNPSLYSKQTNERGAS